MDGKRTFCPLVFSLGFLNSYQHSQGVLTGAIPEGNKKNNATRAKRSHSLTSY